MLDVLFLAAFIPAQEHDNNRVAVFSKIHPVTKAEWKAQLIHTVSQGPVITVISLCDPPKPDEDAAAGLDIAPTHYSFTQAIPARDTCLVIV